jgi:hypothetical protein
MRDTFQSDANARHDRMVELTGIRTSQGQVTPQAISNALAY